MTVGMATRGEFDSVYFTLTGLAANHPNVRYLVVDNTPERCYRTEGITRAVGGTYIHRPDLTGTSKPRDAVFKFAQTPWVMCIDSHVIFQHVETAANRRQSSIGMFLSWLERNGDSRDLVQGPLLTDDGHMMWTHWNQAAPPGLWGEWQRTFVDARGVRFVLDADRKAGRIVRREVMTGAPIDSYAIVNDAARHYGWRQVAATDEPFEIPMLGLGCWAMRKDAWPGFNSLFRGFGGEEGYIHEKVRQGGGKCLMLPFLQWRHKFRDLSGRNAPPAPYPLRTEDHTWNLLVGHRELGIKAESEIYDHFGKRIDVKQWEGLAASAERAQPFGGPRGGPKRQTILAVWYTDNTAPESLLRSSLAALKAAADGATRHDVKVITVGWKPIEGNPFPFVQYDGPPQRSHKAIVHQLRQGVGAHLIAGGAADAVACCEHDVLYPADYFDRHGDALGSNPSAAVSSNTDYIGLNATGWLAVVQRDEPMHQLCIRWGKMLAHLDALHAGSVSHVEPDHAGARNDWVRVRHGGPMPSVHVNHQGRGDGSQRFTNHGEVCYAQHSGGAVEHGYWGNAAKYWPGDMVKVAARPAADGGSVFEPVKGGGCTACEGNKYKTVADWFAGVCAKESDFHQHAPTVKELADRCERVAEISAWNNKPTLISLAASSAKSVVSYAAAEKIDWRRLTELTGGERFRGVPNIPPQVDACDLLIVDTQHDAVTVYHQLRNNAPVVSRYMVVHTTDIYGETGDNGKEGVNHAIRRFVRENPEWTSVRRDTNNFGLVVLSRDDRDKKRPPGAFRKAMNLVQDVTTHLANGLKPVPPDVFERRLDICADCPDKFHDKCGACGCPLAEKASWASEECGRGKLNPRPVEKPLLWHRYNGPADTGLPKVAPNPHAAPELEPVTVGYDFDGTLSTGNLKPSGLFVVISGRLENERTATMKQLKALGLNPVAVFLRTDGKYGDGGKAGCFKAATIARLGLTKYYEDNPEHAAYIRKANPGCEVILVK